MPTRAADAPPAPLTTYVRVPHAPLKPVLGLAERNRRRLETMNAHTPHRARLGPPLVLLFGLLALASSLTAALAPAASAAAAPLTPSAFTVSALCSTPSPGHAGCLGLRLVARDPLSVPDTRALPHASHAPSSSLPEPGSGSAPISGPEPGTSSQATEFKKPIKGSLSPANVLSAYNLTGASPPGSQTIALVDAYDDATIAADLEVFNSQYGLPACNEANGCFRKVNQAGHASPLPPSSGQLERGWAQEIATDVEVAHGVCQSCRILLVEAKSNANSDLYAAEQTAAALGANEISNSWGGAEPASDSPAFNHPGIVITASSGDSGYLNWFSEEQPASANYPASSPHVVAVGGTRLTLSSTAKTWEGESVWNDGGESGGVLRGAGVAGSGCSVPFAAAAWQRGVPDWSSVGCGAARAVADTSADADPYTGVAVYDSTENPEGDKGWGVIGGTSVASPIIASVFALAGGAHGAAYPARTLYESALRAPASLHDVVSGSNGECLKPFHENSGTSGCSSAEEAASCSAQAICLAAPGYDGPTGVGTPNGLEAFGASSAAATAGSETAAVTAAPTAAVGQSAPGQGASGASGSSTPATPVVSSLSLTRSAIAALSRRRPRLSKLGFSFTLNTPARVRVTVSKRLRVRGRVQWRPVSIPFTILAAGGPHARRLSGRSALAPGRYRLTLRPAGGSARSIAFRIGWARTSAASEPAGRLASLVLPASRG
jgi:hypothetical protein